MAYKIEHETIDGIERITYRPEHVKYKTPLVFQHGAWHAAWCWQQWQDLFAEWGWVSHAHSRTDERPSITSSNWPVATSTMAYSIPAKAWPVEPGRSLAPAGTRLVMPQASVNPYACLTRQPMRS